MMFWIGKKIRIRDRGGIVIEYCFFRFVEV